MNDSIHIISAPSTSLNDTECYECATLTQDQLKLSKFHRGLVSLKEMQEMSFSLVNQALLRHRIGECQLQVESENNNDETGSNNNKTEEVKEDMNYYEANSMSGGAGRLAFSVENILAPGIFGQELDEGDHDQYGE